MEWQENLHSDKSSRLLSLSHKVTLLKLRNSTGLPSRRRHSTVESILLFGAEVWADVLFMKTWSQRMISVQSDCCDCYADQPRNLGVHLWRCPATAGRKMKEEVERGEQLERQQCLICYVCIFLDRFNREHFFS